LTAYTLFGSLREAMATTGGEMPLIRDLSAVGLLVIDEIQERADTQFEDRTLTNLIDARYYGMRPTILIGNLRPSEFAARIGSSIASRIRETGGVIEFNGPSFRDKPQK
jgi:DNA replication protein DnaC